MTDNNETKQVLNRAQYIKDLSFENPKAPQNIANQTSQPQIDVSIDVTASHIDAEKYEVVLNVKATATVDDEAFFITELAYGGLFALVNIPEEEIQPLLLVHCPTLLFPYARRIISDATRDGGLPPLMLEPVDFGLLYQRRMEQLAEKQKVS